jgi:hypothetical protein
MVYYWMWRHIDSEAQPVKLGPVYILGTSEIGSRGQVPPYEAFHHVKSLDILWREFALTWNGPVAE